MAVSQSTEMRKPRLVTDNLRDWGERTRKVGRGLFSKNFRKK